MPRRIRQTPGTCDVSTCNIVQDLHREILAGRCRGTQARDSFVDLLEARNTAQWYEVFTAHLLANRASCKSQCRIISHRNDPSHSSTHFPPRTSCTPFPMMRISLGSVSDATSPVLHLTSAPVQACLPTIASARIFD